MGHWLRRFLGLEELLQRVVRIEAQVLHLTPPPAVSGETTLRPPLVMSESVGEDEGVPPQVEAMVNFWWKDAPQAAQSTRTYARALLHRGMDPEQVARRIAEHGTVIE